MTAAEVEPAHPPRRGTFIALGVTLVLAIGMAGLALALDDATARFWLGIGATLSAAVCITVSVRQWHRSGGRLVLLGKIFAWTTRHRRDLLVAVAMSAAAFAAAMDASPWMLAPLFGLVGAVVMWRLSHPWPVVVAIGLAMAVTAIAVTFAPLWLAAPMIAAVWIVYLFVYVGRQAELVHTTSAAIRRRLVRWVGLVLGSMLLLAGTLVGLALIVGRLLAARTTPVPFSYVTVGAAVLALVIVVLVCWWWRSYVKMIQGEQSGYLVGTLLGVIAVGVALGALDKPSPVDDRPRQEVLVTQDLARGRFDLLLVVDPGDPLGRALIQAARRDIEPTAAAPDGSRAGAMFAPRVRDSPYDVAYGIAVPERGGEGRPLWRLVEPPTTDARELARSLASLDTHRRPVASGSYGRLLFDVASEWRVGWRRGARRGVAFLLDRLPSVAAVGGSQADHATCPGLMADHPKVDPRPDDASPVRWDVAMVQHCSLRRTFRAWHFSGRPRQSSSPIPIQLYVTTREKRASRISPWAAWAAALGGRLDAERAGRGGSVISLLRDAIDLHTGVPIGAVARAARHYRPFLRFDHEDDLRPVDVDWLLGPDRRPPAIRTSLCEPDALAEEATCSAPDPDRDVQRVCDRSGLGVTCQPINSAESLAGSLDELIDLAGDGRPQRHAGPEPPRIYVHARDDGKRVVLDYWWFFRYNSSPWRQEVNCLPGLTFGSISCHDHEGDWEGVSVVLERHDGVLHAVAGIYDAHGRSIQWDWPDLEHEADRPVVYVAVGSHASYPARCRRDECDQGLSGKSLGDGGFDGQDPWDFNGDDRCRTLDIGGEPGPTRGPCLVALPSIYDALLDNPRTKALDEGYRGALWNAFPGVWGRARCTPIGDACAQVEGPDSPSLQNRFRRPNATRPGPRDHQQWTLGDGSTKVITCLGKDVNQPAERRRGQMMLHARRTEQRTCLHGPDA